MQSNTEMLLSERRARLLGMAESLRADLDRNEYPELGAKGRKEAYERADRWEREAGELA